MPGNEVEGEAAAVLLAVFEHHPKHAEKLAGQTLSCFVVKEVNISRKPGAQQLQKCFWVRRSDGSEDDFSVNRCLEAMKGVPSAEMHLQDVLGALLNAVYPHLRWFKGFRLKKYPLSTCPYSGEELTGANSIAVNEFPLTNAKLIKEWLQKQGVKLEDIKVRSAEAGSPFTKTLASKSLLKVRCTW